MIFLFLNLTLDWDWILIQESWPQQPCSWSFRTQSEPLNNAEFCLTALDPSFDGQISGLTTSLSSLKSVIFDSCEKSRSNQKWEYFGTSIKPEGHGNLCLDTILEEEKGLTVEVCNHAQTQIFTFALKNIK